MSDEGIPPPKAIVVGLNGSSGSLRALRWAVDEAALRSMPLQMVHTWQRGSHDYAGGEDQRHTLQFEALERTTGWVLDVCGVDLLASVDIVEGSPAAVLVERSRQAGLLVIGTQAHQGLGWFVAGSVSHHCLSQPACPIVAVMNTAGNTVSETDPPDAPLLWMVAMSGRYGSVEGYRSSSSPARSTNCLAPTDRVPSLPGRDEEEAVVGLVLDVDEPEERVRQLLPVRRCLLEQRRCPSLVLASMDRAQPARADRVGARNSSEHRESRGDARHLDTVFLVEDKIGNLKECLRRPKPNPRIVQGCCSRATAPSHRWRPS
jgi:nucleotide-binding universal stress UspA family protein